MGVLENNREKVFEENNGEISVYFKHDFEQQQSKVFQNLFDLSFWVQWPLTEHSMDKSFLASQCHSISITVEIPDIGTF